MNRGTAFQAVNTGRMPVLREARAMGGFLGNHIQTNCSGLYYFGIGSR
jgi:hypothetical protein